MKFAVVKKPFRVLYTDPAKYIVITACRGGGKTIAVTQYAMHSICTMPNCDVLFFSSTLAKARETTEVIMREYMDFFKDNNVNVIHNRKESRYEFHYGEKDIRYFSLETYEQPDKRRGSHPYMVILDEASLMSYTMFDTIIDPMLSHLNGKGKILIIGTVKGRDKFYELYQRGLNEEFKEWSSYMYKASDSGLLDLNYVETKRLTLPPEIFEQEYECNFDVSVGAGYVYSKILYQIDKDINRDVNYDPMKPVYTAWDLGHSDYTSVWFFQVSGNRVNFIDFYELNGEHISTHATEVASRGYSIRTSFLPHDARNKNTTTINTVEQVLSEFGLRPIVLERTSSVWHGIEGARTLLKNSSFNSEKCKIGIEHLKNYKVKIDPKTNVNTYVPIHDVHSDCADAFRYVFEAKIYWEIKNQGMVVENQPVLWG